MDDGKRYTEYGLFGALAIGLAAGLLAGMAIYAAAYPAFQSSEWAAWVQAFGTIGAVVSAFLVARHQDKRDRANTAAATEERKRITEQANKSELESAAQIVERLGKDIETVCDAACSSPKDGEITPYRRARYLKSGLDAINQIPLYKMPYSVISDLAVDVRHQANVCVELLEAMSNKHVGLSADALAHPLPPTDRFRAAKKITKRALKNIDDRVKAFDGESPPISQRLLE